MQKCTRMDLVELLIIYLACGAPFAVYRATSKSAQPESLHWLGIVGAFSAWPISAVMLLWRRLDKKAKPARHEIEAIRQQIEDAAFDGNETQSLFEFREVFYRLAGLADSLSENTETSLGTELFDIAGQHDTVIAARCLARLNRGRLLRHYADARHDFLNTIAELAEGSGDESLYQMASCLCSRLGDPIDLTQADQRHTTLSLRSKTPRRQSATLDVITALCSIGSSL